MMKWLKKNQPEQTTDSSPAITEMEVAVLEPSETNHQDGFFARFRRGLSKTRHQLGENVARLLLGKKEIDATLLEELESLLIAADLGLDMTKQILQDLHDHLNRKQLTNGEAVYAELKKYLQDILSRYATPSAGSFAQHNPFVILMIGVNGSGKTTTIGKLAKQYQQQGKKVMLAAGDTFRAAAIEQLQVWGERNQIPVIAQHTGADSASVIYDAFQAAKSRGVDVLIADTAGRLHTQYNLMEELKKVKRVLQKIDPTAPHEIMLVLDACIGQNALNQARQFNEAVGITSITMTKLDGTAKGGILFAIANELKVPFRYIGVGEGIDDLQLFDGVQFVDAIL